MIVAFNILGIVRHVECNGDGQMTIFAENINGTDYATYVRRCELSADEGCTCERFPRAPHKSPIGNRRF